MLTPGLRESYRRTFEGFGHLCLKRGASGTSAGGASTDGRRMVALAREYVELQSLERAPGPVQLQGVISPLDLRRIEPYHPLMPP